MDLISKAMNFAKKKHAGQLDDEGNDYYDYHLIPVALAVTDFTGDNDIIAAALLHDTLEDTDTTYEELVREFNKKVADLVLELTHEGAKDSYGFYFPRLKSKEAIMIKLVDRASNISRMGSWDDARVKQYLKRTKFWKDGADRKEMKENE